MNEAVFARLVAQFLAAIADGTISGAEAAGLLQTLAELVPTDSIFEKAGAAIADVLYRDADELRASAARKRKRATDRASEGRTKRAKELREDADALEARAVELDAKTKAKAAKAARRVSKD